jgi:Tfp pilus assembly PilM family ATPase
MNIPNLLTKEKRVAGIEISDSVVRIAFFRPQKKGVHIAKDKKQEEELALIEEPIAANIIADGVVTDIDLLGKTLKSIWEKAKLDTDYAIVSIPDDKIYSKIFSFPKSVEGVRLTEAMRLAISFQLPMKTEDIYLDWERTAGTPTLNEILLSTIPKEVAQKYITALEIAGIKTLALESHLASIARAVKLTPKEITIFSKKTPDGATIFALEDGILRFSRSLPLRFISEDKISSEIKKVKMALETQLSPIAKKNVHEEDIINAKIRDDYAKYPELGESKSKWLVPLGAAIRAKIPEGEDNLVSLLPVGTEEAYAYQKATIFITLIRNMTIGVSAFFVIAFLSAYIFVFSLSQKANNTISTLSSTPVPPELLAKETSIERVNALTGTASSILAETPLWSILLEETTKRITDGITISSFSAPSISSGITLTGVAHDRATLNQFRKSLQESAMFTDVVLPVTNLEQKENIPFSTTFRVSDPSKIYYK